MFSNFYSDPYATEIDLFLTASELDSREHFVKTARIDHVPAGSRALNFRTHVGQAGKSFIEVEMQHGQLQLFSNSDLRSETSTLKSS